MSFFPRQGARRRRHSNAMVTTSNAAFGEKAWKSFKLIAEHHTKA
jgi:hypothetical protein